MSYKNKYHCGSRIWRKLGWGGKAVYNEVYGSMKRSPDHYQPNIKFFRLIADKDWEIICRNAACEAAWAADKAVERLAA
jgi:hypothetical protein